ncbi:YihY/virulence factor BrkB family protein [Sphingomonas flavalba]|uniref:YihY/virulence factor BrkB family protein n=1 Tax=Sphingomonas flavalba TaxID=2559804 RepID=UPI0039DF8804
MTGDTSPLSPEARRRAGGRQVWAVVKRVAVGTFNEGFPHAGNLAYLSLLTLFPFFILLAALAQLFGQTADGQAAIALFLSTVPPSVADVLRQPIADVLAARSGMLLWLGALVGLWSTASFIETIRDILRRAYGVKYNRPFYEYRLISMGIIIGSVLLALIAFAAQVLLIGVEQFVYRLVPIASGTAQLISLSRLVPPAVLFVALYIIFYSLTPSRYRRARGCPKWPGALLVTLWWQATTELLPVVLGMLGSYNRTYGSLAGVIVSLLFFFVIGLGVVVGAELNAALAEGDEPRLKSRESETHAERE